MFHAQQLNNAIVNATTINELVPFLEYVVNDIEAIKLFIKGKLKHSTVEQTRTAYYSSLSIQDFLPTDLIQTIASFDNSGNLRAVSKTFQNCCNQNMKIEIKQNENNILSKFREGSTYIVHPTQTTLSSEDIACGFKGPINDINAAIVACDNNDTILIDDGKYYLKEQNIHKSLKIMGRGQNVNIRGIYEYEEIPIIYIYNDVYIKSVSFEETQFLIGDYDKLNTKSGNLYLERCMVGRMSSSYTFELYRGSLNICNSVFASGWCIFSMSENPDAFYLYGCRFAGNYNAIFPFLGLNRSDKHLKKRFKCLDYTFDNVWDSVSDSEYDESSDSDDD
eukprot:515205_1